jgi:hypothetical protein
MSETNKINTIRELIENAETSLRAVQRLLADVAGEPMEATETNDDVLQRAQELGSMHMEEASRVINGIFDGQHMIGPDGKQYSVPANYASKSKLVEGDMLKLTITADGSFVYKQVGPVDRRRVVGTLMYDDVSEEWKVSCAGKLYAILLASVTYFKGEAGDEVVVLLPKDHEAKWGAVENIIKAGEAGKQTISEEVETPGKEESEEVEEQPESPKNDLDEI